MFLYALESLHFDTISHRNVHPRSVWYPPKATSSFVDVVGCDIRSATSSVVDDVVGCDIESYLHC